MTATPTERLTEPALEDPLNDQFEFLITSNAISPTYWACKWSETVLGTDPLKWVTFAQLTAAISAQVEPLKTMAAEIDKFATTAYHLSTAMSNALQTLLDWAAIAVIEWAAAQASALSGVGLVATTALVAAATTTTLKVIAEWGKLVETFNAGYVALEAIAGIGFGVAAVIESAEMPALPTADYDHPGA
ncbi:hypothetical protein [Nocardia asteroides]